MVASNSTVSPSPSVYRVDVVCGEQGNTFQVVRCDPWHDSMMRSMPRSLLIC